MSVSGGYQLILRCDSKFGPQECPIWSTINAETRMEAKLKAREYGWLLGRKDNCYCPDHAEKRRESWR